MRKIFIFLSFFFFSISLFSQEFTRKDSLRGELTTPTAAALIRELATPGNQPLMKLLKTGYGFGQKHTPPYLNAVQLLFGEESEENINLSLMTD